MSDEGSKEAKKMAFILMNVKVGTEQKVLEEIKKIPQVKEAYITMGGRDMIVKVVGSNIREIYDVVLNQIRHMPYISQTVTLVVAGEVKEEA